MTGRVIGIDPSLTATGIASSAGWTEVTGEDGKRTDGYPERLARLRRVSRAAWDLLGAPDGIELAVIEGPAYSRGDPGTWDRAYLWWNLVDHLAVFGVPVAVVTTTQLKVYATGKGTAGKGAVIDAVARRWPQYETGGDDNAADAAVLLAMGLDRLGRPLAPVPQAHRRALDKIAWPEPRTSPNGASS